MRSRAQSAQHRTRGARWTTHITFLCPALAVLLATAVMCLGYVAHGSGGHTAATTTTAGAPAAPHSAPVAYAGDCPSGDVCCAQAFHHVTGVLVAPVQRSAAVLPRTPGLPRRPDGRTLLARPPPAVGAPDLHVLQVQRT
ncbi:hypothetical protein [Streptomyces sp. NPDC020951]|uniref:hypothetical protein n=1 Tax=Streptomyces sp. NPDC020951 TaxID=3365104 RepID=UPI0037A1515E